MLNTASVEHTNSVEHDLTWKKVRKGSRSSSRLRKQAMKPEVGQQQQDDKSTKKEPASISEPEKPAASILGRRFADKIELVPIKKRRFMFPSTSTPPQNPPPSVGDPLPAQTQSSIPAEASGQCTTTVQSIQETEGRKNPQVEPEESASGQRSSLNSVSGCNGPTAVKFSPGTEDRKSPLVANIKTEDSTSGQCSGLSSLSVSNGPTAFQFSPGTEDPKTPLVVNIKTEVSTLGQCSGLDSVSGCNGPTSVKFSQGTEEGYLKGKVPQVANIKLEDSSVIDDKCSPMMGILSNPVGTGPSRTASLLEKVSTSEKTPDLIQDGSSRDGINDDSKVHIRCDASLKLHDEIAKGSPIMVNSSRPVASDSSPTALTLEKTATSQGATRLVEEASTRNDTINDPNVHTMPADNSLDAKVSLTMDDLSRPLATDSSHTASPLEKAATSEGTTNLVHEASAHDDGANMSVKCHEERDRDTKKVASSRKDDRLNWDLNTVMEAWDLPNDDCVEGTPNTDDQAVDFSNHMSTGAESSTPVISTDNLTMGTAHFEIRSGILLDPVVPQKITPETKSLQSKDELRHSFDAPDKGISRTESLTMGSYQMLDVEYPASKLGKTGSFQASPEHDNLSASGTTFEEGQPVVTDGMEENGKEAPPPDAAQKDDCMQAKREQVPKSYDFLGDASVEDCDYGGYDSDVSQSAHGHIGGVKNRRDSHSGYESPFEDGELRELDALARLENEENEAGFETECVDYDLDERDADEFDAPSHCVSEIASDTCQVDKGSSTEKHVDSTTPLNESNGPENIDRDVAEDNVASQENVAPDHVDGLIVKSSSVGEVGPRETRERVFRQPEEPLYSGGTHRDKNTYLQRSRYRYDSSFHSGKVFGSGKPIRRNQDESQGGRPWVGSCGNLRKLPPTGNDYSVDDEDPRPRSINANSAEKDRFQRRLVHNPSNNYRQPFIRRRSPSDRDDSYSTRGRVVEGRDGSHFRSRGRPGIYRPGGGRGPRDEYGPMCDGAPSSSVQQPHYTARRERSFSPALSRDNNFSHPRRRSRSRSRSPPTWHLQRDRSMGVSPPGRSSDFRSDPRMERVRPTFRKSNFAAGDDEFMPSPPPRSRFSPPCNSRWIDDRKCGAPNFRGRKMGGRFSTRNERFHAEGSPEPMKSDDCYRSTTRPGRFSEFSGGRGRGRRYDSSSDRMKYRDRYEFSHRPRHYDTSPVPRRFSGGGTEDCSENEVERVRDTDGRDVPQRAMEERGPPRYNKERMYG